jgi:hypothetical protein
MGLKKTMTLSFVNIPMNWLKTQYSDWGIGPSTVRISWVHLAMMRAVGVSSSHLWLQTKHQHDHSGEGFSQTSVYSQRLNQPISRVWFGKRRRNDSCSRGLFQKIWWGKKGWWG